MAIPRWSERAAETPDAPALVTAERTWTCAQLAELVSRAPARLAVITGSSSADAVIELCAAIETSTPALMIHPRWAPSEAAAIRARVHDAPAGTLAIVATSGTSGTPKLAVLSRRAMVHAARASAEHLGADRDDRWLLAMPIAHVGGLGVVVRSLVQKTPIVIAGPSSDWLPLAHAARVTHLSLVPTMLARVIDRPPPPSLRVVLVGGAACPAPLLERALASGWPVRATYGLTETCGQVATARASDPGSLVPLPGVELRIVDETIRVRSASAMDGWLDGPSPFDADGCYDTGDLGVIDERGRVSVLARRTDLIVSGGENVYPTEVEAALERVPGVRAACVFGVPDELWGQRVAAALVVDSVSDARLVEDLGAQLASFKRPRLVARLDALALGATGKIDRAGTARLAAAHLRELA
jgi:O-succinylbenzoic acid--CoA ligase